jgi:hypothetical protein
VNIGLASGGLEVLIKQSDTAAGGAVPTFSSKFLGKPVNFLHKIIKIYLKTFLTSS